MSPIQMGSLRVNNSVTNISRLGTFNYLQRAVIHNWMGLGINALWRTITAFFFKGRETLWGYNTAFISDEYEKVKKTLSDKREENLSSALWVWLCLFWRKYIGDASFSQIYVPMHSRNKNMKPAFNLKKLKRTCWLCPLINSKDPDRAPSLTVTYPPDPDPPAKNNAFVMSNLK